MSQYNRPGRTGGTLIRRVISLLKNNDLGPFSKKIAIACSGGADSMAMAELIIKFGRKISDKENLIIVHINHGWRGLESDEDENFVREYANKNGIKFERHRLNPPTKQDLKNRSPEQLARTERKKIYADLGKRGFIVLTAHHADDAAETLIWRLCSGNLEGNECGILFKVGNEVRPMITTSKEELIAFLKEQGLVWREDRTNSEGKLLRSKMRKTVIPAIREVFPNYLDHMTEYSEKKRKDRLI